MTRVYFLPSSVKGLVKEYANFLNDDKKPASEKFWELEKLIKEDKRHPGVVMELKKSEEMCIRDRCNTHEPHAKISSGKKGYVIALRTGPGMRECERIIATIEHFYRCV